MEIILKIYLESQFHYISKYIWGYDFVRCFLLMIDLLYIFSSSLSCPLSPGCATAYLMRTLQFLQALFCFSVNSQPLPLAFSPGRYSCLLGEHFCMSLTVSSGSMCCQLLCYASQRDEGLHFPDIQMLFLLELPDDFPIPREHFVCVCEPRKACSNSYVLQSSVFFLLSLTDKSPLHAACRNASTFLFSLRQALLFFSIVI